MFTEIGIAENFTVTNTEDATVFDDLGDLLDYEAIVFSNTSGNGLLTDDQQANLEAYIDAGGAFLGIHAATDTYRNQSWPFYNALVGGIVQANPNHTNQNFIGIMDVVGDHPSTANLPNPWEKEEEYYYWEQNGGQLDPNITPTLRVRATGDETYDAERPISWYREFSSGARSYYTALGHKRVNYTTPDNDFRQLIRDALCWCVESVITTTESIEAENQLRIRQNPVSDRLELLAPVDLQVRIEIWSGSGKLIQSTNLRGGSQTLDVAAFPAGIYLLKTSTNQILRFVKN